MPRSVRGEDPLGAGDPLFGCLSFLFGGDVVKRKSRSIDPSDPGLNAARTEDRDGTVEISSMMDAQDPGLKDECDGAVRVVAPGGFVVSEKEPKPGKAPDPPPAEDRLPSIPLKVFAKIAGPKWDQMAGFLHHAKIKNIGPRTVPEWRATYQAFLRKPVK